MKPTRSEEPTKLERPIPSAYWVVPGRLLAGSYPGSRWKHVARPRVLRLLDAGITLFVDLTEEGEAPPYAQWLDQAAQHVRMPIRDFDVPSPEHMTQTLDVIDAALGTGHSVYVHCLAGLGRTGTVVGCFLVRHGMDGTQALQTIQMLRRDTLNSDSPSPVTDTQRWMVAAWENEK
jgi:hypothetical protein